MKIISTTQEYLSPTDVSGILNLSLITIKRYIRDGRLPSVKIGGVRRIRFEDIKKLTNPTNVGAKSPKENPDLKIIPGFMGNKAQMLSYIKFEINKIANKNDIILDIFSGSGAVGYSLKQDFIVYSNDIEPFSRAINSLLLDNSLGQSEFSSFDYRLFEKYFNKNYSALTSLNKKNIKIDTYKSNHRKFPYLLFTTYFSNNYFGEDQVQQIDSLRYAIDMVDKKYRNALLCCLMYACYQTVSSVGSHFAQPKIVKRNNIEEIKKKRTKAVKTFFFLKLREMEKLLYVDKKKNVIFNSDFKELFSSKNEITYSNLTKVSVTYVDPPYTIDHYSRFYHILNTLVLYDYPEKNGNGLYREDRYQSNFSIKSKAYEELDLLVSGIAGFGSKLIMSYSDGYRAILKTHQIIEILNKHYKTNSVRTPIKVEYLYSGFGQSAYNKANELLFIATNPRQQ